MIDFIAPRVETLVVWSAETTAVALALALVAALADRWKKLGPAARHALWLVILVKLVTPPVVQWPWSRPWSMPAPSVARIEAPKPSSVIVEPIEEITEDEPVAIAEADDAEIIPVVDMDEDAIVATPAIVPDPVEPEEPAAAPVVDPSSMIGMAAKGFAGVWLLGSIAVALVLARKILRFHRRVRDGVEAPDWLVEETANIGALMSVKAPSVRVVADLSSPVIWCFGRPVLLVPEELVKTLGVDRWRCVLAHELAHLRRGDHWVSRIELIAAIAWWWNPVYWWARRRVDFEAELACDAWVVATLPSDRITFAESLIRICSSPSLARNPAPSMGVAGSGREFERRLTMILSDRVSARPSLAAVFGAAVLSALALPSWTMAGSGSSETRDAIPTTFANYDENANVNVNVNDDDDAADDEKERAEKAKIEEEKAKVRELRAEKEAIRAKARAEAAEKRAEKGKKAKKAKKEKTEKSEKTVTVDEAVSAEMAARAEAVEKAVKESLGPDFEKKMEAFGKEMEKKFGPGSDFEKQMEAFGKEIEAKMGPGSDFEKKMEAFGKEMEKKFGPGSDFEKQMKEFGETIGKEMEEKLGPDSEVGAKIKEMKERAHVEGERARAEGAKARAEGEKARIEGEKGRAEGAKARAEADKHRAEAREKAKSRKKGGAREAQIRAIEKQIESLAKQLEKLRAEGDDEDQAEDVEVDTEVDVNIDVNVDAETPDTL